MPEVTVSIGGRDYEVACQPGEERFLETAAELLDTEATAVYAQTGRLPEARMLLMAGLMLADKTAAIEDKARQIERENAELRAKLARRAEAPSAEPERIEVPVIPETVLRALSDFAAHSEAIAAKVEKGA